MATHDDTLFTRFKEVRKESRRICDLLEIEDLCIQAIPEGSPPKWHLAHTTWFFETFLLNAFVHSYQIFNKDYSYLFNSYYEGVGRFLEKNRRSVLSRPLLHDVLQYRDHVDAALEKLLADTGSSRAREIRRRIRLGIAHEEQHQELMLTDIKANFFANPMGPAYLREPSSSMKAISPLEWLIIAGGVVEMGATSESFSFDNERPRHPVLLKDFKIASRPVLNREFLEFIDDGAYQDARLWLSDGWNAVKRFAWKHPLYWQHGKYSDNSKNRLPRLSRLEDGGWNIFTLSGWQPLELCDPLCHISYYEADAFARWSGARLPTEAEWEHASSRLKHIGNVWEWTASPYLAYPGFRPLEGELGEYNGKFMCNQFVLRGGSQVSPRHHVTSTYRNYFSPQTRWQFSGIRLAEDLK